MIRPIALCIVAVFVLASTASANLVISQYYEGPSNSKWIELFNSGATAVNLSNYSVGLWRDANTEGYKTGIAPNASARLNEDNLTLPSGGVFLLKHGDAGIPLDLVAGFAHNQVLAFSGNDSFAIYAAGAYSTTSLVDVIGFTNSGNQGVDKGFVRLSLDPGYSLLSGSNVLNFGAVWKSITMIEGNLATPGIDAHLGTTHLTAAVAVAAIPEPTAALFGSLLAGAFGLMVARRPAGRE